MNFRNELLIKYEKKVAYLENLLKTKTFEAGEADSGKESRFPTGLTEREDQIQQLLDKLFEAKSLLKSLKNLPISQGSNCVSIGSVVTLDLAGIRKDFVVNEIGDFNEGILSTDSPLGKAILGKSVGDQITLNNNMETNEAIYVVSIK